MTKQIPLRGKYGIGKFALVDDDDYEHLIQYKWRCDATGYARCSVYSKPKKTIETVLMHRLILNTPDGFDSDHINGDRLDNRRSNLRVVTEQQNSANRNVHGKTSIFKGIHFDKRRNYWTAQVMHNGKSHWGGSFSDEVEAAKARDELAKRLHGVFAKLNFPLQSDPSR